MNFPVLLQGGIGGKGGSDKTNVPDGASENFPGMHNAHKAAALWTRILSTHAYFFVRL
jgi:hypothetical protein